VSPGAGVKPFDDIKVMFVVSPSAPQSAGEVFDRLEARLPSLKGRNCGEGGGSGHVLLRLPATLL
jgi:hypothetical protein